MWSNISFSLLQVGKKAQHYFIEQLKKLLNLPTQGGLLDTVAGIADFMRTTFIHGG